MRKIILILSINIISSTYITLCAQDFFKLKGNLKNFNEGILDGPFYWSKDRVDYGLEPCIETGVFRNGVYERTSEPCEVGD